MHANQRKRAKARGSQILQAIMLDFSNWVGIIFTKMYPEFKLDLVGLVEITIGVENNIQKT
jgi:hypothetical protein